MTPATVVSPDLTPVTPPPSSPSSFPAEEPEPEPVPTTSRDDDREIPIVREDEETTGDGPSSADRDQPVTEASPEDDSDAAPLFEEQRQAGETDPGSGPEEITAPPSAAEPADGVPLLATVPASELPPRPFAVMVENEPPARPQSGLWRAAVVYEIIAEEITRFMPIYLDGSDETEIGPVRSARDYFADISTIFDAIYVHCGGSPRGLAFIRKTPVDDIDAIRGDRGFYRTRDRRIPHNLYVKLSSLPKEADRKKYRRQTEISCPFLFRETPRIMEGTVEIPLFTIPYYRRYQVSWRWRPAEGVYRREHKGREFLSKDGKHPHDTENVVIHRIHATMIDNQMRHEMDLWAGGTCEVFSGGERIVGHWQRERDGRIVYLDGDNNEIRFNPGRIWIQFVEPKLELIYGDLPAKSKKKS